MSKNYKFIAYGVMLGLMLMTITSTLEDTSRLLIACALTATVAVIEKRL